MREGGSGSFPRASSTFRFILCLVTESLAVFFDTTTAYPSAFFEITAEKFADEMRRPDLVARINSERFSRLWRGNTVFKRKAVYGLSCVVSV